MGEDGVLWLSKNTALTYSVPASTTPIEVLAPVVVHGTPGDNRQAWCIALLLPEPFWWTSRRLLLSVSVETQNRIQQTLFLLPVDPAVEHKLYLESSTANATSESATSGRTLFISKPPLSTMAPTDTSTYNFGQPQAPEKETDSPGCPLGLWHRLPPRRGPMWDSGRSVLSQAHSSTTARCREKEASFRNGRSN